MLIPFRQGIYQPSSETRAYFEIIGNSVSVKTLGVYPLICNFAYYTKNVIYPLTKEYPNAWKNLPLSDQCWLYIELNVISGEILFKNTRVPPTYGTDVPESPVYDLHFFDTKSCTMKVWNGSDWDVKLGVFVGRYENQILNQTGFYFNTSQVDLNHECNAGKLLFTNNKNITANNTLVTSTTKLFSHKDHDSLITQNSRILNAKANEGLQKYTCVRHVLENDNIEKTTSLEKKHYCTGLVLDDTTENSVVQYITKGFIDDPSAFYWNEPPTTPIFVSSEGKITTIPPTRVSIQKIGHIVNTHTIFLDPQPKILIDDDIREKLIEYCLNIECPLEVCLPIECPI